MGKIRANRAIMGMAAVLSLLGVLLIFVPQISVNAICYFMSGVLIGFGIVFIVKYFITESFRREGDYGLSIGLFFTIMGAVGLVHVGDIIKAFPSTISIIVLILAIVTVQDAVDLRRMETKVYVVIGIIAVVILVWTITILVYSFKDEALKQNLANYLLVAAGGSSILSKLLVHFSLKNYESKEKKGTLPSQKQRIMEEASKEEALEDTFDNMPNEEANNANIETVDVDTEE